MITEVNNFGKVVVSMKEDLLIPITHYNYSNNRISDDTRHLKSENLNEYGLDESTIEL